MDNKRFWKLLKPIHPQAENFCRRLSGTNSGGDDLYQESLLNAIRRFESLKNEAAFKSWLYQIIVNRWKNENRLAWWRRRADVGDEVIAESLVTDPRPDLESRRWLRFALCKLNAEDKALIVLYEIDGWKISELAGIFGKPEGTIKARLARTREKMRKAIEGKARIMESLTSTVEGNYGLRQNPKSAK